MKYFLFLPIFLLGCGDYPTKDDSEANPIEVNVNIVNESINNNDLNDPSDNITSESSSNSDSNSLNTNTNSDNDSIIIDNSTR